MPHHPHDAINTASACTWLVGTAASICSDAAGWVASWFTNSPALIAQATDMANSGGLALGILGLATLFINRFYEDRRAERDERQRIRDRDEEVRKLRADLEDSRQKRHDEAATWNRRFLEMQDRLSGTRDVVRANTDNLQKLAGLSGVDLPAPPLPDTAADLPTLPPS